MVKKTMTYTDFDGVERTEDFYFNLSTAELTEMEVSEEGGLTKTIERLSVEKDNRKTFDIFKSIILKAYGRKSPDGKFFMKNDTIREEFECSPVFSDLLIGLLDSSEDGQTKAVDFINSLVPKQSKPTPSPAPTPKTTHR